MPCVVKWAEPDADVMAAATRGVGKSSFLFERKRLERLVEEIRANSSVVRLNWRRFLDPRG